MRENKVLLLMVILMSACAQSLCTLIHCLIINKYMKLSQMYVVYVTSIFSQNHNRASTTETQMNRCSIVQLTLHYLKMSQLQAKLQAQALCHPPTVRQVLKPLSRTSTLFLTERTLHTCILGPLSCILFFDLFCFCSACENLELSPALFCRLTIPHIVK